MPNGNFFIGMLTIYLIWLVYWVFSDIVYIKDEISPELHECATILQDAVLQVMGKKQ